MDELYKLKDEIVLITSDIESNENSLCEDCTYSTFRRLIIRHEESRECQKQVDALPYLEYDVKIVSGIRVIANVLIQSGKIRTHVLENKKVLANLAGRHIL